MRYLLDDELDYIHLHINKKQGKLRHLSAKKEASTYLAQPIYHNPDEFCPAVFEADLETRPNPAGWGDPDPRTANRDGCFADHGPGCRKAFPELPSGAEPSAMVEFGSGQPAAGLADQDLRTNWSGLSGVG
jgi:hypothetical protein